MSSENASGTLLTLLLGIGIGSAATLLFSPKAGKEIRSDLAEGVNDGIDQVRSTGKNLKRRAQKVAELGKNRVEEALDAGSEAYVQAKQA